MDKPSKETLLRLRVQERRKVSEIKTILGATDVYVVKYWLRFYGIVTRKYVQVDQQLTQQQNNVVVGSLLGDGHLKKCNGRNNSKFCKTQSIKSSEYVSSLLGLLEPFSLSLRTKTNNGGPSGRKKSFNYLCFSTIAHPIFTKLRQQWYPSGDKRVPRDLILNSETLAWWFCDDGHNKWQDRHVCLCTHGFPLEDNNFLVDKLAEIDIKSYLIKVKGGYGYQIKINDSYYDFMDLISDYVVWDCMKYKTDKHGTMKGLSLRNKSGVNGVVWDKSRNKWMAYIILKGKQIHLGRFKDIKDAEYARINAEKTYRYRGMGAKSWN